MALVAKLTTHLAALLDELTSDLAAKEKTLRELNEERGPLLEYVRDSKNTSKRAAIRKLEESTTKLKEAQAVVDKARASISESEKTLAGVSVARFKSEFDAKESRNSFLYYEIERLGKTIEKMAGALRDETIKAMTSAEAVAELGRAEAELAEFVLQNQRRAEDRNGMTNSQANDTGDWGLPEKVKKARERVAILRQKIGLPPKG